MGSPTFFRSNAGGSGGSGSASDYLKDNFNDVTVPASNNTGLTSNSNVNFLGAFFNNDDLPKYSVKTLWIDKATLLPQSQWKNNKATYEVTFTENWPGVKAYAFGNVRLRNLDFGKSLEIKEEDDGLAVSGVIRRIGWIINPTDKGTATYQLFTDNVDTTNTIDVSDASTGTIDVGVNKYNVLEHQSSNATKDIHEFRIQPNQGEIGTVSGIIVYYENATSDIDLFPGSTYVDKAKITTTGVTTAALTTPSGNLGAATLIRKTDSSTYALDTVEPPNLVTVGQGASGATSVSVTTGTGASFPIGSGIVGQDVGGSIYVGSVTNVSTDTLTVTPALDFGISGPLYKAWWAGSTIAINASLLVKSFSFIPENAGNNVPTSGFNNIADGDFYHSDREKRYRIWGDQLQTGELIDGEFVLNFNGNTTGFFQVDGRFDAAEIEWVGASGILHGTFGVNGTVSYGINEAFNGVEKKTVFTDAGPGWNSFNFSVGASFNSVGIRAIHFYELDAQAGASFGHLAQYRTIQDQAERTAVNATLMQLGTYQRIYADEMYVEGTVSRGTTHTSAGGVFLNLTDSTGILNFGFYGREFGVIGSAGTSLVFTLNGASIAANFNSMIDAGSEDWHQLVIQNQAGTTRLEAIDFTRTVCELENLQNYLPRQELDTGIQVVTSSTTPRDPKEGTIWAPNFNGSEVYIYLFGAWNQFSILNRTEDPNAGNFFVKSMGSGNGVSSGATGDTESFNLVAWATEATAASSRWFGQGGNAAFQESHYWLDGASTGDAVAADFERYNRIAWSTLTNRSTARERGPVTAYNYFFWGNKGVTTKDNSATGVATADRWNGAAWSTGTAWNVAAMSSQAFILNNLLHCATGLNTAGSAITTNETRNSVDAIATGTASTNASTGSGGSKGPNGRAYNCSLPASSGSNSNAGFTYNGAAWAALTAAYTQYSDRANGALSKSELFWFGNGGQTATGSGVLSTSQIFNGVSVALSVSSSIAKGACQVSGI